MDGPIVMMTVKEDMSVEKYTMEQAIVLHCFLIQIFQLMLSAVMMLQQVS